MNGKKNLTSKSELEFIKTIHNTIIDHLNSRDKRLVRSLKTSDNFKSNISGTFKSEIDERCDSFYFYLRYFELVSTNSKVYQIGVATDYAKDSPDAPEVWVLDKNLKLEQVGSTTIEKYSISFVLER